MTIETKGIAADLKAAQQELEIIDQEAKPKTYTRQERLVKALEIANNQSIRASKAEKAGKKNPSENKSLKNKEDKQTSKKDSFDYGELAYLEAKGVSEHCHNFLFEESQRACKELKELLGFEYIKEGMKKITDEKASEDAIPDGSKRAGKTVKSSIDYWLSKGQLPPADQPELRREYVNAKMKKETDSSKFTDKPVVGS